jgi:DNA-binding transcriptional MocR family regulator
VGWCVPGRFRRDVERAKLTTSIATSVPAQEGIAEYLRQGGYERHLRGLRATFEANQRAALVLIAKHFPEGTRATAAQGGYFTWIALPAGFDAMALHARALREGISVAPGPMFSTTSRHASALRLNFGHRWDAQAGAALARLGSLAHKAAPHR